MTADKKYGVLFVDDERRVLNSLKRGLLGSPYRIYLALSGFEALELLGREDIQVIVSDMKMPEMNGLELLQEVSRKFPEVIRLVLSGYSHTSTVLAAVNEGRIFRYITKPWSIDDDVKPALEAALAIYEQRRRERHEAEELRGIVDNERRVTTQTRKKAGEFIKRKTNAQRQAMERVKTILNYVADQAINLEMALAGTAGCDLASGIRNTCRQALSGLEKVHLFNELEFEKPDLAGKSFSPDELLCGLEPRSRERGEKAGIKVFFQKSGEGPQSTLGDGRLVETMFWELLENALENTPAGGLVSCISTIEPLAEGKFEWRLTIQDTGPGIAEEQRKVMLQPFVCGDNCRKHSAWGVGLPLARLIALRLGGSFELGRNEPEGCRVGIVLPLCSVAEENGSASE